MTQAGEYRRGETVRILDCPLNQQHRDMTGTLIESSGRVVCVELPTGTRCWTARVEHLNAKNHPHPPAEAEK